MTEAAVTGKFLGLLREAAPDSCVTKYNDHLTSGLPDASVTYRGRTVWLEFKVWPAGYEGTLKSLLKATNHRAAVQLYLLWRHHVASDGRAFLVVFKGPQVSLYQVCDPRGDTLVRATSGSPKAVRDHLLALTS